MYCKNGFHSKISVHHQTEVRPLWHFVDGLDERLRIRRRHERSDVRSVVVMQDERSQAHSAHN